MLERHLALGIIPLSFRFCVDGSNKATYISDKHAALALCRAVSTHARIARKCKPKP
jgi:hypothetical protein